jgi:hypothetical protein
MGSVEVKRLSDLVLQMKVQYQPEPTRYLLLSDVHFDHPYCDRDLFFRLMDKAKEDGAGVLFNGDFFCMMQGRMDKRGGKGKVRPEHQGPDYFNLVITEAAEKLAPYADIILMMGDGNHETSVLKWNEINPLDSLCTLLKYKTGADITRQGYHGYVKFSFHANNGGRRRSALMYHHHGKYGGEVTKGVLGVNRYGANIRADIYWSGHTHDLWHVTNPYLHVTPSGKVVTRRAHHIKTGTFKDEFNRKGGFGVERINKPAAKGGYWLEFEEFRGSDHEDLIVRCAAAY